jgi:predicted anti-sigma-YlaC factor YlaD
MDSKMHCKAVRAQLADLLLDPAAASPVAHEHLAACAECGKEFRELQATMIAMDAWEAPEPTQYFDTRLAARLREEKANPPASLWERMRARLLYGSNLELRPIAAGTLALLLMIGGGTAVWMQNGTRPPTPQESAIVNDLQLLDGNAQVYQQLNSLDADADDNSGSPAAN